MLVELTTKNNIYVPIANVTTNIMGGQFKNYSMPLPFPNITGIFQAKAPQYIYYEFQNGTIITGQFHNWIIQGNAIVNSTQTEGISETLERQSVVLIANYTELTTYMSFSVQVVEPNALQVKNISVQVDGKNYKVPSSIKVLAGFVSITIPQVYLQESNGYIYSYEYDYPEVGNTQYSSFVFFVNPQTSSITLRIHYTEEGYYVYVTLVCWWNTHPYTGNYFILNGTVYDYNHSYWILAGKYVADPTGMFVSNNPPYSIVPVKVYYNNLIRTNTEYSSTIINLTQSETIIVYYGVNEVYQAL